ncbi:MAG: DUF1343 domain-containing protein [Bacteroidales bacterium]|nr:DUF1343 domain-containing protein [Bacteroidales bacterium]
MGQKLQLYTSVLICLLACSCQGAARRSSQTAAAEPLLTGAQQTEVYFPWLADKSFALVINQTSQIDGVSLADTLCRAGLRPQCIFAPEHGFRGTADAGAAIADGRDPQTGLRVFSLYGNNKKPSPEQMEGLDYLIFDIQDVGCRFYTYLSTLHYVMEACAENGKTLILLDRPNPDDYVDGPLLEASCRSFVGMHPIPILHGCTLGELAGMINGQGWLAEGRRCSLKVVTVKGWRHGQPYSLPVKPSPNLPSDRAVRLYPSLCLFEGTSISVGRGTTTPFEIIGAPDQTLGDFQFVPRSLPGFDSRPMYRNQTCFGIDLRQDTTTCGFSLRWLLEMYRRSPDKDQFFKNARFFDLLAGTPLLRQQILEGLDQESIRQSWQASLSEYRQMRAVYLLYP